MKGHNYLYINTQKAVLLIAIIKLMIKYILFLIKLSLKKRLSQLLFLQGKPQTLIVYIKE